MSSNFEHSNSISVVSPSEARVGPTESEVPDIRCRHYEPMPSNVEDDGSDPKFRIIGLHL